VIFHFGWIPDTDTLADRSVEIETRVTEHEVLGDTRIRETIWWTAVRIGITDRLELALPAELSWFSATGIEQDFSLRSYGAQLRYRIASEPLVPVLRLGVTRDVIRRDVVHAELDATVAYARGRFAIAGELGLTADVNHGGLRMLLRPSAGASFLVIDDLRLGAEVHAELDCDAGSDSWSVAGPTLAWTHGRFWLAAHYGFGVSNIDRATRLAWGAAF
jgi:hypothetical protein